MCRLASSRVFGGRLQSLLGCVLLAVIAILSLQPGRTIAGLAVSEADDLTISEYPPHGGLEMTVDIHASRVFEDFQRWGFFRIGALPLLVAENVRITVQSEQYLTNAFADLDGWRPPGDRFRRFEVRNLEITIRGENQPLLRVASARIGAAGVVNLKAVAVRGLNGWQPVIPTATLQVSGPAAGWLSWNSGARRQQCFIFQNNSNHNL
jgi:hypothetical protein